MTEAAQTAQVVPTNTQVIVQPTSMVTQVPATPTTVSLPTATSTPIPTATMPPTPTSASCTNLAKFVADVTIPDDTEMLPGQVFIKTWRLQNVGTCTWSDQYGLFFVNGDQMNGTSPLPLTGSIAPSSTVDLSVTLKAPGTAGTYRGTWVLYTPSAFNYNPETDAIASFYVQIKVVEGVSELNLGTATWTDNLDNADNWYLLDTVNTKFTEGDGKLVMTSINPGGGEEWDLSDQPSMDDYYLQATFITGSACSGLDKYGLLARAPDPDKGYVFEFSCDGHYRLYTWDGQNYNALQEWRTSSSILAGTNQTNVMGIYMDGTTLRLYANGHKLAEFTDNTFGHGQFGLVIGSVNTNNFTVSVDQVAYWEFNH
ncbi:MAG: NBR1-Ig-like domain-containing protein [Anaerolineales bacterium]